MITKLKAKLTILSIMIFFLCSCEYFNLMPHKEWQEKNNNNEVDVYVGGYYTNLGNNYPCYWKNGFRYSLPVQIIGTNNAVESIVVEGNDVYSGGHCGVTALVQNAVYWKNNERIKVNVKSSAVNSYIYSLCAVNGVVFSAGNENLSACYWINEKQYFLPNPGNGNSEAKSIFVDKETLDFYISGYCIVGGITTACYWVNGKKCILISTDTGGSDARGIYVSCGKVYIAEIDSIGCFFWVDGVLINLPNCVAILNSIFVNNGNVYTIGSSTGGFSYWKNTIETLINNSNQINNITINNNEVFIAGDYDNSGTINACYWKNGNFIQIENDISNDSSATSIFVKPK